jgi:hypothetical protein
LSHIRDRFVLDDIARGDYLPLNAIERKLEAKTARNTKANARRPENTTHPAPTEVSALRVGKRSRELPMSLVLNRADEDDRRETEKERNTENAQSVLFKYVPTGNQNFALVRKVGSTIDVRAPHAITIKPGQTRDVKLPARFRIADGRWALRLWPANSDLALACDYVEGTDKIHYASLRSA